MPMITISRQLGPCSPALRDDCERVIAGLEGVDRVENGLTIASVPYLRGNPLLRAGLDLSGSIHR